MAVACVRCLFNLQNSKRAPSKGARRLRPNGTAHAGSNFARRTNYPAPTPALFCICVDELYERDAAAAGVSVEPKALR